MSRLAENLIEIFKVVNADKDLWRLLYYPSDPLNPTQPDVQSLPDYKSKISKTRIIRSPKTDDLTTDGSICRICMYLGNSVSSVKQKLSSQDVIFDVYAHIDAFDKNDARSLRIIDRLNVILNDVHLTGIGRAQSPATKLITNPPNGYIGYRVFYVFGSVK